MNRVQQWVAVTVVGCLTLTAAGWFLLVSPKRADAAALREQTASQEAANTQLRTQLGILKAQAKDLPKKQADLARVAAKIPDHPGLPALIRALTAASTSAGVQLVSVTPGPPAVVEAAAAAPVAAPAPAAGAPAAGAPAAAAPAPAAAAGQLASIPVAITVFGGYFEVEQFLANIEDLPRALRVNDLQLLPGASPTARGTGGGSSKDDGRSLTSTISGSIFMAANRPAATPAVAPVAAPAK